MKELSLSSDNFIIYIYIFDVLFQRWKEQYFVNVGTDCGLTIAGFYYVCFSCNDGSINGFYYDPNSRYGFLPHPLFFIWPKHST